MSWNVFIYCIVSILFSNPAIDECAETQVATLCLPGECRNTPTSHTCVCPKGYQTTTQDLAAACVGQFSFDCRTEWNGWIILCDTLWLIDWLIDEHNATFSLRIYDWLIDWLINTMQLLVDGFMIDWLIDWLIDEHNAALSWRIFFPSPPPPWNCA